MKPRDRLITELHAVGMTDRQIGEHPEVMANREAVRSVRRRLGLSLNRDKTRRSTPKIDREYLAREFDESMKALLHHGDLDGVRRQVRRVAMDLDVSYESVRRVYVKDLGLLPPAERKYTDEQYEEARRLLEEQGLYYTEVARMVGIDRKTLGKKFPGHGLNPGDARTVGWVNEKMRQMGI